MAIGISITKNTGRMVFELTRDGESTTRVIEVPYAKTDTTDPDLQTAVDTAASIYTSSANSMNLNIQPANWRDSNVAEEQWTTVGFRYEIVSTTITPIEPENQNQSEG